MSKAKEQRKKIQRAIVHLNNTTKSLEVASRELRSIGRTVQNLIDGLFPQQEELENASGKKAKAEGQEAEEGQGGSCEDSPDQPK